MAGSLWLVSLFLWQIAPPAGSANLASNTAAGFTAPRRMAILAAAEPGRLHKLLVKEGEFVEAGQLVASLEDETQKARLEMSKHRAESQLLVDQAGIKQKRFDEDRARIEELRTKGKASEAELIAAQADSDIARVQFKLAHWEHQQDQLDVALQSRALERLAVRAPFAGFISERLHELGESVETRDGIVRLIELDTLLVLVDFPLAAAVGLKPGDALRVIPNDKGFESRSGRVEFVNRLADAASQTVRVKLAVPNEDRRWIAGMRVNVELSPSPRNRKTGFESTAAIDRAKRAED